MEEKAALRGDTAVVGKVGQELRKKCLKEGNPEPGRR